MLHQALAFKLMERPVNGGRSFHPIGSQIIKQFIGLGRAPQAYERAIDHLLVFGERWQCGLRRRIRNGYLAA